MDNLPVKSEEFPFALHHVLVECALEDFVVRELYHPHSVPPV